MFEEFSRVSIELSNRCNYSKQHALCPAGRSDDVQILPLYIIEKIVDELKTDGWGQDKTFSFHVYNEPTNDPRLYWLIKHVKKELPGIRSLLATNGWYLNGFLLKELLDAGLEKALITVYGHEEHVRIKKFSRDIPGVRIHVGRLKPSLMNPRPKKETGKRCYAPICDLVIRSSGNVGLCCLDYDETIVFGNVFQQDLTEIIRREFPKMKKVQSELKHKVRHFDVCQECSRGRSASFPVPLKHELSKRQKRGKQK